MLYASFSKKEIASLIDALTAIQKDPELQKATSFTNKKVNAMLFKLWRIFEKQYD